MISQLFNKPKTMRSYTVWFQISCDSVQIGPDDINTWIALVWGMLLQNIIQIVIQDHDVDATSLFFL